MLFHQHYLTPFFIKVHHLDIGNRLMNVTREEQGTRPRSAQVVFPPLSQLSV